MFIFRLLKNNKVFRYSFIVSFLILFFILLQIIKAMSISTNPMFHMVDDMSAVISILLIIFTVFLGWNLALDSSIENFKISGIFFFIDCIIIFFLDDFFSAPNIIVTNFFFQFLGIGMFSYYIGKIILKK